MKREEKVHEMKDEPLCAQTQGQVMGAHWMSQTTHSKAALSGAEALNVIVGSGRL